MSLGALAGSGASTEPVGRGDRGDRRASRSPAAAIFGSIYKVPSADDLAPGYALIWCVLGLIYMFVVKGRQPASEVLADLPRDEADDRLIGSAGPLEGVDDGRANGRCGWTRLARRRSEHAARLVAEAWRSFDRFRPEEPPLDERVVRLLEAGAARRRRRRRTRRSTTPRASWTSRSRSRGRGTSRSSGRAGSRSARSPTCSPTPTTSTWRSTRARPRRSRTRRCGGSAEFIGFPAAGGAFTSGGTISNVTRARGRARASAAGSRHAGLAGPRVAVYCSRRSTTRSRARSSCSGSARTTCARSRSTGCAGCGPTRSPRRSTRDLADGRHPDRGGRDRGHDADRRDRSARRDRRRLPSARRLAPRRRRVRAAGGGVPESRAADSTGWRAPTRARRRPQMAVPAEGVRRGAGPRRATRSPARSRTSRATCRISSTSCTPPTSPSSTRARSAR